MKPSTFLELSFNSVNHVLILLIRYKKNQKLHCHTLDSGGGEGQGDHTQFGVVYGHLNATMYFRTNQNLQRLVLKELNLATGAQPEFLPVENTLLLVCRCDTCIEAYDAVML